MLALQDEFKPVLLSKGIEAVCPDVAQTLTEEELIGLLPGCDGWIIGDDPATSCVVQAGKAGGLRAAVKWGVGVDNIDFQAFAHAEIPIDNTPQMFGTEVADIALGYVIGLARQTFQIDREVRNGRWPKPQGMSLLGKVAGIVGMGDIGQQLAKRLLVCGMKVQGYDPALNDSGVAGVEMLAWPQGIDACHVLILCCSLNDGTRNMINARSLDLCKFGLFLVNVSRGGLVVGAELATAMDTGQVAGAALDVFEEEPINKDSPILLYEQCIFGSHNASNTLDAARRTTNQAVQKLLSMLA
jgi:D-3-phosphoglycerate dehydrogenase